MSQNERAQAAFELWVSGSGLAKLGLRAQNLLAHYMKNQFWETFGDRALSGLLDKRARAFRVLGLCSVGPVLSPSLVARPRPRPFPALVQRCFSSYQLNDDLSDALNHSLFTTQLRDGVTLKNMEQTLVKEQL